MIARKKSRPKKKKDRPDVLRGWVLYEGGYYSDGGCSNTVFRTKAIGEQYLRGIGYKYNKAQDLFCKDEPSAWGGGMWARLEPTEQPYEDPGT